MVRPARAKKLFRLSYAGVLGSLLAMALVPAPPARGSEGVPSGTKRVFVLSSFGRDFAPYSQIDSTFRTELSRDFDARVDFLEVTLGTQVLEPTDEEEVVRYMRALFTRRLPDLVVTNGPVAASFHRKHRGDLFTGVSTIHGAMDERWLSATALSPRETAVVTRIDVKAILENILRVLPETKDVFVIFGDSAFEKRWIPVTRREWEPFRQRVRLTYLDGLSFDEILRRAAALPPNSAIFYGLMMKDVTGVPYEHESALLRLRSAANAPIFGWTSVNIGRGIVGGPLMDVEALGREMARIAGRILRGEAPGSIPVRTFPFESPVWDARELVRWGIDEKRLPPGSEVRFRQPSFFQEYRGRILAAAALLFLQAFAIGALVEGRRRQHRAEREAARLRAELAHVGRVTVLGQLSSSLAHELAQPLGAILRNAEAAELYLAAEPPDLEEIRAIVADIKSDDFRAREVIERMRGLLKRRELNRVLLEPAALVEGVFSLIRPDARNRGVRLEAAVARDLPVVTGDPVHLQQVLLNLFVNAMEAMEATPRDTRVLSANVRAADRRTLEIAVTDTGPGIPAEAQARLFQPFQTTKREGMGMGLAICRTLVEAHGGQLRYEGGAGRGATFVVRLPAGGAPA